MYNLYAMCVSLRGYDFVVEVVKLDARKSKIVVPEITDVTCPRKT